MPYPEQSIARVAKRVVQGGHHIPEDVIRRRHSKGLKNLFSIYRPLLDRWSLFDNERSPIRLIARETSNGLMVLDIEAFAEVEMITEGEGS